MCILSMYFQFLFLLFIFISKYDAFEVFSCKFYVSFFIFHSFKYFYFRISFTFPPTSDPVSSIQHLNCISSKQINTKNLMFNL